jgi:hypothetical protein
MNDDARPEFRGLWYLAVTLLSLGLLAWLPFAHAAIHLRNRLLALRAVGFAALAVVAVALVVWPSNAADRSGSLFLSLVIALSLATFGTRKQIGLRRRVYGGRGLGAVGVRPALDPAIRAILAGRELREAARAIVAKDPLMANELRIGRPDLSDRSYDDGGLVDLNAAPATAIAQVCELPFPVAEAIVAARPFATVDDVITMVEIPLSAWGRLRDRGIAIWF